MRLALSVDDSTGIDQELDLASAMTRIVDGARRSLDWHQRGQVYANARWQWLDANRRRFTALGHTPSRVEEDLAVLMALESADLPRRRRRSRPGGIVAEFWSQATSDPTAQGIVKRISAGEISQDTARKLLTAHLDAISRRPQGWFRHRVAERAGEVERTLADAGIAAPKGWRYSRWDYSLHLWVSRCGGELWEKTVIEDRITMLLGGQATLWVGPPDDFEPWPRECRHS